MTKALVVDDSTVDRELVARLLREASSIQVEFAGDGLQALDSLDESLPDIVITDLHMPELDGLQLVEAVRANHASLPIVLMTGMGSEDLAVSALRSGAASYVPKAALARDLVPTVMQVLALARSDHSQKEMQKYWEENYCKFCLPNDYNLVSPLVNQLNQQVGSMQLFDATDRFQLSMALEEAISNAIYFGNLELTAAQLSSLSYDLNDTDETNIVDERRETAPYRDRHVFVEALLSREEARFVVRDEGPGFDHQAAPAPEQVVASVERSGRRITHMQLFCDEIRFNPAGNEVTLIKRC
jgi:CheY-like chemotaxis protein